MFDHKKYFLLGVAVAAAMSGCGGGGDEPLTQATNFEREAVVVGPQQHPTEVTP